MEQPPQEPPAATAAPVATGDTTGRPIDEHWDDGSTIDEATVAGSPPSGAGEVDSQAEEMTVEEGRTAPARLVVIAGNDTGREFTLHPGKPLSVGRAIENDVVLTDIAVSRKHLDLVWDGSYWVLKDRGSGNGTLINDRIEDGQCRLQHGDRIEIGHTVFRFDHTASAGPNVGVAWGVQNDDEASTVAGRAPPRPTVKGPPPAATPKRPPAPAGALPAIDRKGPTLPPPNRARTPSQGPGVAAVSSRLALPADGEDAPPRVEPAILSTSPSAIAAASDSRGRIDRLDRLDRSMTATAHVDPLPFGSGSMPPVHAYPQYVPPVSRKRLLGVVLGVLVGASAIGAVASMTTEEEPAGAAASAAVPIESSGESDPAEPAPPEPEPIEIAAAEPIVDAAPAPAPAVDPPKIEIVVPPPPKVEAPTPPRVEDPPPPPKVDDKKTGITRPDPRKRPDPPPRVVKRVEKKPPPRVEKKPAPSGVAAAKKKAQGQYASKAFADAAATLRGASDGATSEEADELRRLAADYDAMSKAMASGDAAASARASDALTSYKKALAIDKRLGGVHASAIREKLGQIAPKAAASFMAKGNYEAAKQAADTAVNFGSGSNPLVASVRKTLENKASEFYSNGVKLMKTKPEEGKALLRRVQKIVPPDSQWYTKAYKALNARTAPRDDDE